MPPYSANEPPALQQASPRQFILGVFVVGQLGFMVLANLIGFYHDAHDYVPADIGTVIDRVAPGYTSQGGHAWKIPDELSTGMRRWVQLTGQDQRWSLFAPSVYKVTGFPALLLVWENAPASAPGIGRSLVLLSAGDGVQAAATANLLQLRDELQPPAARVAAPAFVQLAATGPLEAATLALAARQPADAVALPLTDLFLSDNEPADRHHFLRLGKFRFRRYESSLILYLTQRDDESEAKARERWAPSISDHVSRYADALYLYVKWRLSVYRSLHPDRPAPQQVILVERVFPMLPPDDTTGACWQGPNTLPLLRWQPQIEWQSEYRPIERYNPVTEQFESFLK